MDKLVSLIESMTERMDILSERIDIANERIKILEGVKNDTEDK